MSLPAPPQRMSLPSSPYRVSSPTPPKTRSSPRPASMLSLPASPRTASLSLPASMVSLPKPPVTRSSPPPESSTSSPTIPRIQSLPSSVSTVSLPAPAKTMSLPVPVRTTSLPAPLSTRIGMVNAPFTVLAVIVSARKPPRTQTELMPSDLANDRENGLLTPRRLTELIVTSTFSPSALLATVTVLTAPASPQTRRMPPDSEAPDSSRRDSRDSTKPAL